MISTGNVCGSEAPETPVHQALARGPEGEERVWTVTVAP